MTRAICIVGPTASGKTAAALALAQALGGEVLSCDSVAVYRGLDIGAAKPTPDEQRLVPHHLIGVAEPDEAFSAARWAALADRAADEVTARGRAIVVAGGSGLYLRAWLRGLVPTPPVDAAVRARHRQRPPAELHAALARVDPESAARIAETDRVRISRALEVWEQTGVTMTELRARQARTPRIEAFVLGLAPPRSELYARIDARVDSMMAGGLLEEVRGLFSRYGPEARALGSLGYRQLVRHLAGELALDQAVAEIKRETRRFARRQLTWFRAERGIVWYASVPSDLPERAARFLLREHREAHGTSDG